MAKDNFIGSRLNPTKDKDIADDLKRFVDRSKRFREAYRLAMAVERGEYVKAGDWRTVPAPQTGAVQEKPMEPLVWKLPEEPRKPNPKASVEPGDKNNILANIKQSF